MDTSTGKIYESLVGESLDQLAGRIGVSKEKLVPLKRQPDPKCWKCSGKGYRRKGSYYKPCKCTL